MNFTKIAHMAKSMISLGVLGNVSVGELAKYKTEWLRHAFEDDVFAKHVQPIRMKAAQVRAHAHECLRAGRFDLFNEFHSLARKLEEKTESFAYDIAYAEGNVLLNEGINTLLNLAAGQGAETNYGNANARLGVGDSATAPSATQTGLLAGVNNLHKGMNATFPTTGSGQQIVFKADFLTGEGNYAWLEQTADNGLTPNKNLHRSNTNLGTKVSGTWTLTDTITLS